jgi:hypothetical protein
MEGLPRDIDLSALVGREITIVRIGKFLLHYFLNDDFPTKPKVWIQVESSDVTVVDPNGRAIAIDDFRTNGALCAYCSASG